MVIIVVLSKNPNSSIYQLISSALDGNHNSLSNIPNLSIYQLASSAFDGSYNSLSN